MSDLIGRVQQLEWSLDGPSVAAAPPGTPAATSAGTGSAGPAGAAGATGTSPASFQQVLHQAQAGQPTHQFAVGQGDATQMPSALARQVPGAGNVVAPSGTTGTTGNAPGRGFGLLSGLSGGLGSGLGGLGSSLGGLSGLAGLGSGLGSVGSGLGGLSGALGGLGSGSGTAASLFGASPGSGSALGTSASGGAGQLGSLLDSVASKMGVDPALAKAVARAESNFNPQAVSPAGAQGLMQVMPSTFRQYASQGDTPAGYPVAGPVTQAFGPTSVTNEPPLDWNGHPYRHFHTGVDIAVGEGTPIHATMSGTIQIRSDPGGYGNLIVVQNGPWDLLYGHTSGHPANIQTGTAVQAGQVIGFAGSTGNSTGPHVHYEVRYDGQILDPSPFLRRTGAGYPANPMDPLANATAGVGYLKQMLDKFHNNVPAALAAYNAGPAAVQKYGGVPPYPETQAYVQRALQYARAYGG
ncbi:MAG: transglycosylase SLT domain-containing protein [Chloroflexota bacterium]